MRSSPAPAAARPRDLPLVALSQGEIERLERQYPQIEDVLPLSPLQEGLLFHALYDAQAPDVYTVQLVLASGGRARRGSAARRRCRRWCERHASLRAGFRHEGLSRPVQVIVPRVELPWRSIDLSLLDEAEREQRLADMLAEDRAERFDLAAPPLLRFTLIRLVGRRASAGAHQPSHPDGWLVDAGAGAGAAHALCAPGRCRRAAAGDALPGLSGLACRAGSRAAIAAWREALAGLEEPHLLAPHDPGACAGRARADHAGAERDADRGADRAGARARV